MIYEYESEDGHWWEQDFPIGQAPAFVTVKGKRFDKRISRSQVLIPMRFATAFDDERALARDMHHNYRGQPGAKTDHELLMSGEAEIVGHS